MKLSKILNKAIEDGDLAMLTIATTGFSPKPGKYELAAITCCDCGRLIRLHTGSKTVNDSNINFISPIMSVDAYMEEAIDDEAFTLDLQATAKYWLVYNKPFFIKFVKSFCPEILHGKVILDIVDIKRLSDTGELVSEKLILKKNIRTLAGEVLKNEKKDKAYSWTKIKKDCIVDSKTEHSTFLELKNFVERGDF